MTTTVKLKNSVTTTNAPVSLQQGEVAINITDKKVWVGNAATTPIQLLGGGADGNFSTITVTGNSFLATTSGNVGIGTITPAYKLDAIQSVNSDGSIQITNANTGTAAIASFRAASSTNTAWFGIGGSSYSGYAQIRANGAAIYTNSGAGIGLSADNVAGYITFGTGSAAPERLRITSAGDVGIGSTTTGGYRLQVKPADLGNTAGNTSLGFDVITSTGNQDEFNVLWQRKVSTGGWNNADLILRRNVDGTANQSALRFGADNTGGTLQFDTVSTERMRIDSIGNVGIGNTPSAWDTGNGVKALQLGASGTTSLWNFSTTVSVLGQNAFWNGTNRIYNTTNFATEYTQSAGVHIWYSAPSGTAGTTCTFTESMRIDTNSNLLFNSGYGSVATAYGCRAWVNFDGVTNNDQAGTYTQSGTTVVVTITGHGFTTGQVASLDFTSGAAVNGVYTVTVTDANVFTVVQASRVTTGTVNSKRKTIRASGNVSSVTDNGTGDYSVNFTTAMPDANYSAVMTPCRNATDTNMQAGVYAQTGYASSNVRLQTRVASTAALENAFTVSVSIFR
jgi:hypothetical protein